MFVLLFDLNFDRHTRQTMAPRELSVVYLLSGELGVAEDVHVQIFSERYKSTKDNFNCYQTYHTRSISKKQHIHNNFHSIYLSASFKRVTVHYKWRSVQTCFELDVTSLSRGIVTALHVSHT